MLFDVETETMVEKMIGQGRSIVREAIETYKPIAVIAAYSGGNDSIVTTHFAAKEFDAEPVHFATGIGIKKTLEHAKTACESFGCPLRVECAKVRGKPKKMRDGRPFDVSILPAGNWRDGKTPFEEYVFNFGFPGIEQHGRMYQRLKEKPMRAVVADLKRNRKRTDCVLVVSGIRQDESSTRAGYKRAVQKDASVIWVNPFYWTSAVHFEAYRQEFGLPRNPVKTAVGISGECLCGAYAKPGEKERVRAIEPETAEYLDRLEAIVRDEQGFPWGWEENPPSWWGDAKRGQGFLFDVAAPVASGFRPMCVGCGKS